MKTISPSQILSDQLWQLHRMEAHIARDLLILSGSVLNFQLRALLSRRARAARDRRDVLEDLLKQHAHPLAAKTHDSIKSILAEGNRELARIRHPYSRDVAMIEHCMRIEQHATIAYGIAAPLIHRIGLYALSDTLKQLLASLETARFSFHPVEAEVFSIAACHPHLCGARPRSLTPVKSRNVVKTASDQSLAVAC